jgi:hypothetical protein
MQNKLSRFAKSRRRPAGPFDGRWERKAVNSLRSQPTGDQNAKRNYERYLELARAEARSGDTIAAENYYQHAEHYYRLMRGPG